MAYITRRSGGGWSRVSNASDYANVVSNYASVLAQAQQQKLATELESKVFNYKNGLITYDELKTFIQSRLTESLPGSQKELDLRQLMTSVEDYERNKQKDLKRSQLEATFSKNGISAAEKLQIEQSMLEYYKPGTTEYTEQVNVIAQAKELVSQEQKNVKLAELQGKLSEGGLTTDEQISLFKEAQSMTEKGSKEYADYGIKLADLGEQKRLEDMEKKKIQAVTELLDKFKGGGLTNEELLQINKVEQQYTDPNSEDFVKLKQAEADIIGAIAGSGSGSSSKEAVNRGQVEFYRLEAKRAEIENAFKQGSLSMEDYINQMDSVLGAQEEAASYSESVGSDEQRGELLNRINSFLEQKNAVASGQAAVVVDKNGNRMLRSAQEIMGNSSLKQSEKIYEYDKDGNLIEGGEQEVVTLDEGGKPTKYLVGKNGTLERLNEQEVDIGGKTQTVAVKSQTASEVKFSKKTLDTSLQQSSGEVLGATTSNVSAQPKASSSSKSSSSNKKSSSSSSKVSSVSPKTVVDYTNSIAKSVSTKSVAPLVKTAATSVAKSLGVTNNAYGSNTILGAGVKKGNIPGTVDIGVTEAISSAAKKAASFLGNLFKGK